MKAFAKKITSIFLALAAVLSFAFLSAGGTDASSSVGDSLDGKDIMIESVVDGKATGKGLNVLFFPRGVTEAGVGIDPLDNMEGNEIWHFTHLWGDYYYITVLYDSGLSLNSKYARDAVKGSQITVYRTNSDDAASIWKVVKNSDETYSFQNYASQFWIDLAYGSTEDGTRYNNWSRDEKNQKFNLIVVGSSVGKKYDGMKVSLVSVMNGKLTGICVNDQYGKVGVQQTYACADPANGQTNETFLLKWICDDLYYVVPLSDPARSLNSPGGCGCVKDSQVTFYRTNTSDGASLWHLIENIDGTVSFHNYTNNYWITLRNGSAAAGTPYTNSVRCGANTAYQSFKMVEANAAPQQAAKTGSSAELDATVTTSSSNLLIRKSASASSASVGSMPKGAGLKVLDGGSRTNGFYHIRYNGITGYASASYITIGQAEAPAPAAGGSWKSPLNGYSGTQNFGKKAKDGRYHCGIDITSSDTRVFAAVSGTVLYASEKNSSGAYPDASHDNGIHAVIKSNIDGKTVYTYYCHMSSVCVKTGYTVSAGTQIGVMGSTGRSTGPHLHFGIFTGASSIDPIGYTKANPNGSHKVIEGSRTFYDPTYVLSNGRLPQ